MVAPQQLLALGEAVKQSSAEFDPAAGLCCNRERCGGGRGRPDDGRDRCLRKPQARVNGEAEDGPHRHTCCRGSSRYIGRVGSWRGALVVIWPGGHTKKARAPRFIFCVASRPVNAEMGSPGPETEKRKN